MYHYIELEIMFSYIKQNQIDIIKRSIPNKKKVKNGFIKK